MDFTIKKEKQEKRKFKFHLRSKKTSKNKELPKFNSYSKSNSKSNSKLDSKSKFSSKHKSKNKFKNKSKHKSKKTSLEQKQQLQDYLFKAGFSIKTDVLKKRVFYYSIVIVSFLSFLTLVLGVHNSKSSIDILLFNLGLWTALLAAVYLFLWGVIYFFLDLRIYSRTKQIEEVLPDFLQLTSVNISAGMPIDRALWFSIRPNFGILAKDIEEVAKETFTGEELKDSLIKLGEKYDSVDLKRSINLLLEGMDSGGEMADLLNKIASDIQESRILKQEMSANVATYAIFITFASIVAAPILFGLATQLLKIVIGIAGSLDLGGASGSFFSLNISSSEKMISNFKFFCFLMLSVSAFFSASIVAVIRKGKVKDGIRNIPVFIIVSLLIYWLSTLLLGTFLGGFLG